MARRGCFIGKNVVLMPSFVNIGAFVDEGTMVDAWATVGSSNIDPYSLLLAREANLAIYDARFARELRQAVESAIENESSVVDANACARRSWLRRTMSWIAYQVVRVLTVMATRRDDS